MKTRAKSCFEIPRSVWLLGGAMVFMAGHVANAATQAVYASPNGSGSSCTMSAPCALPQAQAVARTQMASASGDVTVELLDGTYRLVAPWSLTAADSGRNGHNIIWTAAEGAHPVISGAMQITGWKLVDASKNIWGASVGPNVRTRQLFVNGVRAVRARSAACAKSTCGYTTTGLSGSPSLVSSVKYPQDVEVVIHVHWRDFHCPVTSFSGSAVTIAQPCWNNTAIDSANGWSAASPKGSYYTGADWFENAYEFLGAPGQFYIDNRASMVYYVPRSGENLVTADVELPLLEKLVDVQGTPGQPVQNIQFNNLTFRYSTWLQPSTADGYVSLQAGYLVKGNGLTKLPNNGEGMTRSATAVNVLSGSNISFDNDVFTNLGEGGVSLAGGTQNSSIKNSQFIDLSGAGVFAGDTTANPGATDFAKSGNINIYNNLFRQVAQEYRDNVAIMGGFLNGITIDHNTISDLPYSGVSVGWGWNYEGNQPVENNIKITNNRIQDVMKTLFDGGGIYTQGYSAPTSIIDGNYIDMGGAVANGIYCDENSHYFNVSNNVMLGRNKFYSPHYNPTSSAHFLSAWANYSGNINVTNNWSDGGLDMHSEASNPPNTKTWANNTFNVLADSLPPGAQAIYAGSGTRTP
ncbi:right-handed parallel beta-helix repeat-containing protein [Burkholderia stagnalis]